MAHGRRLAPKFEFQRYAGQSTTREGTEVLQPCGKSADGVERGGAKDEAAKGIVLTIPHNYVHAGVRLAVAHCERAGVWPSAGMLNPPLLLHPPACFPVANAPRPTGIAVEQGVIGPQVECRIVEEHPYGNGSELLTFRRPPQLLIQGMQYPPLPILDLAGQGELVVLLRKTLSVALHHATDGDPPDDGRSDCKALQHV